MIRFRKDTPRYWFMSNYYSCEFVMNGIRYKNAEAAFQSHKVPLEERRQFADMPPASAKRFGRNVAIPANWNEALGDHDLMAYVVGELHDLVVRMRPEWLDNEDTSLTIKAFLDEAEYQTFKGLVAMKEDSYTFVIEG